ncbi:unnamed protein product [Chironomus riparius]|uniref:Uncharacterized protein n=1 Tax=Chironomus riparius TaxID=315576 RepID=A0A9N9RX27_9DIPT|nr:unnamed protein product [Chironomus riparius]
MYNEFRICRICLIQEDESELIPIYEKDSELATQIFLLSGIKVLEFMSHQATALICSACIKDLNKAVKFRKKCIQSEHHFKKHLLTFEPFIWNDELRMISSSDNNHKSIKEEPHEFNNVNFFEHYAAIVDEDCATDMLKTSRLSKSVKSYNENSQAEHPEKKRRVKRNIKHENVESDSETQCHLCLKTFTKMHSMKNHMRAVHQDLNESDMFKCEYCDRLFKIRYYLNRHIKNAHTKKNSKKEKQAKAKNEEDEGIFNEKLTGINCQYCNKFLTSRHSLNDHIRVRHSFIDFKDMYLCDICGKDFPIKYYLIRHIRAAHLKTISYKKKNIESLPCSICGKILKSKGNLSTHEKTHKKLTPDEYWYCDLCGNKFKGRGEMSVHIKKRHLYKIRYPCEICPGKSWRTLFQLHRHIKVIHHNIKEFKCEWCGKEFGEKNKLLCHTRIHTGEKPFKCNWEGCDREFTHQTDFRRHRWGHSGVRPYKCEVPNCLKGFMKKSELLAHENRCHPPNPPPIRSTISNIPIQYQYEML